MTRGVIFVSLFLLASLLGLVNSQLPQCYATTCNQTSDCPNFNDATYAPACVAGVCTNIHFSPRQAIGGPCNSSDPTTLCDFGLFCSAIGTPYNYPVCQHTRTFGCMCTANEQCEGGLCLNNTCDAVRSLGDACSSDLQCGSICLDEVCSLGDLDDKCNGDKSCSSGFCDPDSLTCQADSRGACDVSNPSGICEDDNSECFGGQCYSLNGDVGAECNSSLPFPQCKVTLGCVNSTCQEVPEGTPCSDRSTCSLVQDCLCNGNDASASYGCYSKIGAACASTYQALDDCLNACTEPQSEGVPDSCASKCVALRMEYECCKGCAAETSFYNTKGSCASTAVALQCCSSTSSCSELTSEAVCGAALNATDPYPPTDPVPPTVPAPSAIDSAATSLHIRVGAIAVALLVLLAL